MKQDIAAAIVLYNPYDIVKENIASYIDNVDKLYILDNSDKKNTTLINELLNNKKMEYIDNNGNKGIAYALNRGVEFALKEGFTHLLTMDQDSKFVKGDVARLIDVIEDSSDHIGIISPLAYKNENKLYAFSSLISITSGSILNLNVYSTIGAFKNDFFIDEVEVEYCLRMNYSGFMLRRVSSVVLDHKLGDSTKNKFLFWEFYASNHSALRRYYIMRNRLYIWNKYAENFPKYIKFEKLITFKEIAKIVLVEKDKYNKLKMSFYGYRDYKKNKYGKFQNE